MMFSDSMELINSQPPFEECEICCRFNCAPLHRSQSSQVEAEQKSKFADRPFNFNKLSEVIKHCVGVYLDFLDLTRLASTQKANRNMLKNKNKETLSLYLNTKLRTAKVLTPEDIYAYEKASGSNFSSNFLIQCRELTHFKVLNDISYHYRNEADRKKSTFLTNDDIDCALKCCTTIRHLTLDFGTIHIKDLNNITKKCPNLQQLTILGALDLNYSSFRGSTFVKIRSTFMKIINKFKSLKYLAIKPTLLIAQITFDIFTAEEISSLLDRGIHIKLLPSSNN